MKKSDFKIDFIGVGASKCATTWIYQCLKEHPEICMSSKKETAFFSQDHKYEKGLGYYSKFFSHCSKEKKRGEFSIGYLNTSEAPARIHSEFPNVKLIASLRNPIERAYSHYEFAKNIKTRISGYNSLREALSDREFVKAGLYGHNLENYLRFFSEEDIKIVLYEDIQNSPRETIEHIYNFLDVDSNFNPSIIKKKVNATGTKRRNLKLNSLTRFLHKIRNKLKKKEKLFSFLMKTPLHTLHRKLIAWNRDDLNKVNQKNTSSIENINPETREKLREIYEDDISKLETIINEDLSHWK